MTRQKRNIVAAISEHIVSVIVMFITYKYAISIIGLKSVGLWSILIAIFSLSSIGNSGFASSAVKFVAKYLAKEDYKAIAKVITTTFLTVLVVTILMILAIYFGISVFHAKIFTPAEYKLVNEVIIIGGISFLISVLGRVFLSALDGLQLINYRSYVGISSKITYGILCVVLLHSFGLKGLIFAEFMQYLVVFLGSLTILWFNLKPSFKSLLPDKLIFREIFSYGSSFQVTSIFQMLMDPLTKFFLKRFGGLDTVALYDVAYKFFFQARLLIVVIITTFVPYVSMLKEQSESAIRPLFMKVFKTCTTLSVSFILSIFSILPLLFAFMHIDYSNMLLYFSICIATTLFINLLGVTPFMFNLGTGHLKSNLLFTIVMASLNAILGFILGTWLGAIGVLIGIICAQAIALVVLLFSFAGHFSISFKTFFDKTTNVLLTCFAVYLVFFVTSHIYWNLSKMSEALLNLAVISPLIIFSVNNNETLKNMVHKWRGLVVNNMKPFLKTKV